MPFGLFTLSKYNPGGRFWVSIAAAVFVISPLRTHIPSELNRLNRLCPFPDMLKRICSPIYAGFGYTDKDFSFSMPSDFIGLHAFQTMLKCTFM
jgi:hypothetical protein